MRMDRNFVTPLITIIFLVVAITGMLMLFHLFDGYTEVVHEVLGLIFVILAIFHTKLNWNALKIHFRKRLFIPAAKVVAIVSVLLIVQQHHNPKFDTILLDRIKTAPIGDVFQVLQIDSTETVKRFESNAISLKGAATMEEIWINNKIHPKKVFDLIME